MELRVATFNVENLDDRPLERNPALAERAPVLRAMFRRMNADIICLQEVHGQELEDHQPDRPSRTLAALEQVLAGTEFARYQRVCTLTSGVPYDVRNLVILSRYPVLQYRQYRNDHIDPLQYRRVTAVPAEAEAMSLRWERPILHATVDVPGTGPVHVINLHLKSRLPSSVPGGTDSRRRWMWNSPAAWAEGYFLSSIKRVGQALETRVLLDRLFDAEPGARILVCGDFNAEPGEVPVEAILGRVENTANPALRERVMVPCSLGLAESVRFTHLHEGRGNLLDHILVSQSMLPALNEVRILNESLHDESLPFATDLLYPESDHAPFVAHFRFD